MGNRVYGLARTGSFTYSKWQNSGGEKVAASVNGV